MVIAIPFFFLFLVPEGCDVFGRVFESLFSGWDRCCISAAVICVSNHNVCPQTRSLNFARKQSQLCNGSIVGASLDLLSAL